MARERLALVFQAQGPAVMGQLQDQPAPERASNSVGVITSEMAPASFRS
jgi:hypothetical protein